MSDVKTIAEAGKMIYGRWAGNPNGFQYKPSRCVETVRQKGRGGLSYQCEKPPGHGPDGLYCLIHDPERVAKRSADKKKKWGERMSTQLKNHARICLFPKVVAALESTGQFQEIVKEAKTAL